MSKKRVSLRELFDNGIQHLEYGGQIICTDDGGLCHYDLYRDDDIEDGLLLCDGDILDFGEWQNNGKYIVGTSEYGKQIYLSKEEYDIAAFKGMNGPTKFVDWLLEMGYLDKEDISSDGVEIARDMNRVKEVTPKFYNMLMCMCNCEERV